METVLNTGASRGIGLELTKQFLAHGYHVIATYRSKASSNKLVNLLNRDKLSIFCLEVKNENSISDLASELENQVVDILINNAGIMGPSDQNLKSMDISGWLETFEVNTIAPFNISKALLCNLYKSQNPRIITISSQIGSLNRKSKVFFAYRSSKGAVNKVMQLLAVELKSKGVAVCPVHPGWVRTDMGGSEADISVEESAQGIVKFVRDLTLEQSGKFFTWQGEEHDW